MIAKLIRAATQIAKWTLICIVIPIAIYVALFCFRTELWVRFPEHESRIDSFFTPMQSISDKIDHNRLVSAMRNYCGDWEAVNRPNSSAKFRISEANSGLFFVEPLEDFSFLKRGKNQLYFGGDHNGADAYCDSYSFNMTPSDPFLRVLVIELPLNEVRNPIDFLFQRVDFE